MQQTIGQLQELIGSASLVSGWAIALTTLNRPIEEWNRTHRVKYRPDQGVNRPSATDNRPL